MCILLALRIRLLFMESFFDQQKKHFVNNFSNELAGVPHGGVAEGLGELHRGSVGPGQLYQAGKRVLPFIPCSIKGTVS